MRNRVSTRFRPKFFLSRISLRNEISRAESYRRQLIRGQTSRQALKKRNNSVSLFPSRFFPYALHLTWWQHERMCINRAAGRVLIELSIAFEKLRCSLRKAVFLMTTRFVVSKLSPEFLPSSSMKKEQKERKRKKGGKKKRKRNEIVLGWWPIHRGGTKKSSVRERHRELIRITESRIMLQSSILEKFKSHWRRKSAQKFRELDERLCRSEPRSSPL